MAEMKTKNPHSTLESVREAFDDWRKDRSSHNKKIPDYLWQQVLKILPQYRIGQLLNTLKLNHAQLKKHLISNDQQPIKINELSTKQLKSDTSFVQAFIPPPVSGYHVEWQQTDGTKLIINQLDVAGLNVLVQQWRGKSC